MYIGDGGRAWARVDEAWPAYIRSYPYQGQYGRTFGEFWRGAAALLAARERPGDEGERLRKIAEAAARRILGERVRWADPLAQVLGGAVAFQRGKVCPAHTALTLAASGFEAADMRLWAAAARHQAHRLAGDEASCAALEAQLAAQGVLVPARLLAGLVPGFAPP
jgi:hypothetical protein